MLNENNIITTQSWKTLCDSIYDSEHGLDNIPPSSIVHVAMDHIDQFFSRIKNNGQQYIIVSSHSDFGLWEQSKNGPLQDIERYFQLVKHMHPSIGYTGISIPPSLNKERCNPNHKYACKCYRYTNSTFPEIPSNIIHWFITNNTIDDERLTSIPFGILEGRQSYFTNLDLTIQKEPKIYVNFADYTLERVLLKQQLKEEMYKNYCLRDCVVLEENEIPFEQYLENIKKYWFVLCMEGNGIDCYRTLETIYCGGCPIVSPLLSNVYNHYSLQYVLENPLSTIKTLVSSIQAYIQYFKYRTSSTNNNMFSLPYWKEEINKKRELL